MSADKKPSNETSPAPYLVYPGARPPAPRYTIGTLVSNSALYDKMRRSFTVGGFSDDDVEYIYVDNTGTTQTDAYRGLNAILNAARAPIVILCHQDVSLLDDDRHALDARLTELDARDPAWAVAGNAGGVAPGQLALCITDPHGANQRVGELPERVASLDENFLIVRRDSRIGFSHDLEGFHFYGADLCLHADVMGRTCYVIDFHLHHASAGKKDTTFAAAEIDFRIKWSKALSPRWLQTTCALVHLAGSPTRHTFGRLLDGPFARLARRLPKSRGFKPAKKIPA